MLEINNLRATIIWYPKVSCATHSIIDGSLVSKIWSVRIHGIDISIGNWNHQNHINLLHRQIVGKTYSIFFNTCCRNFHYSYKRKSDYLFITFIIMKFNIIEIFNITWQKKDQAKFKSSLNNNYNYNSVTHWKLPLDEG